MSWFNEQLSVTLSSDLLPSPQAFASSFFQAIQNDDDDDDNNSRAQPSAPMLINSAATNQPNAEPDLTSFDFLNDYDEKQ